MGCANTLSEIEALRIKAQEELTRIVLENQLSLFPEQKKQIRAKLLNWHITGFHQVFGNVYDRIGFPYGTLRDLVVARIVNPKSKAATIRYLNRYIGITLSKDTLYRFLDTLDKDALTRIAFSFVSKRNNNGIALIFYDVTTLSFETENEDGVRKKGYSKEHRNDMPQILIGLFVDFDGYPFDFDVFEGNKFEGHTFKVAVEDIMNKYPFENLTVVADAAMLSEDNLSYLTDRHISYIVGARIKNMPDKITKDLCLHDYGENEWYELSWGDKRLIVDYSQDRAKRDRANRERLVKKLESNIASGRQLIRKSKYLLVENTGKVTGVDQKKIDEEKQFDGLKGYVTTADDSIKSKDIIAQYHNLWRVEKAFRMSKNDLRERPVYHQQLKRVKSHLLLCFVSLLVMKEAERILNQKHYTIEKAVEILGTVGQGKIRIGNVQLEVDSELDQEVQSILGLFAGH